MAHILDISATLSSRLASWPGDVGFRREVRTSFADGEAAESSSLHTTAHAGTHADAPSHIRVGAASLESVDLDPYWGPCQVIQVQVPPRGRILPEHLQDSICAPRVLLRTDSNPDPERFEEAFNGLSLPLVHDLHAKGVLLVGIDTPSVDVFEDEELSCHRALFERGMCCLEGLVLTHVLPGMYELAALPLKVEGGDGSPVRAALRSL